MKINQIKLFLKVAWNIGLIAVVGYLLRREHSLNIWCNNLADLQVNERVRIAALEANADDQLADEKTIKKLYDHAVWQDGINVQSAHAMISLFNLQKGDMADIHRQLEIDEWKAESDKMVQDFEIERARSAANAADADTIDASFQK